MKYKSLSLINNEFNYRRSFCNTIIIAFLISLSTFWVQRVSGSGLTNWVHAYDSTQSGFNDICSDSENNLYMVGVIRPNGNTFGGFPVTGYGYEDALLCKTDSNGNVNWIKTMGSYYGESAKYIVFHQNKLIVGSEVNGGFNSDLYIDSFQISIPAYPTPWNGFVAQFDTSGIFQWANFLPGSPMDLKVDNSGNSYALSSDQDTLYLSVFSGTGATNFIKGLSATYSPSFVATDFNGGIAVAETFRDSINFMGNMYYANGYTDILLAQLSYTGNFISASVIGGIGRDEVSGITTDLNGNLIMSGVWSGSVNCLGTTLPGVNLRYFFLSIDPTMNIRSYDDNDFRFLQDWRLAGKYNCVENSNHEFLTTLNFLDSVIAGNDTLTTRYFGGYYGASLVLKYDVNGQLLWYRKFAESTTNRNTGHASLFLGKCDQNKNYVCGQMLEHVIVDSTDYNISNRYLAFSGQIVDTTFDFTLATNEFIDPVNSSDILIFPNPTDGSFTINFNAAATDWNLEIIDINGRLLFERKLSGQQKRNTCKVDELDLASGMYFVKVVSEGNPVVKKLLVE
ncbi:MAG: T9SS type A sorting domain-containing protein [Bacteroidia bacterium]|nr:T9SS type A sorting domain-containing protein [Bacteroidota bacterium]MBP9789557.1 T9SS type A sorting domain-containing protein [Bacteroidia bacterium]MBP9922475.1 T9SS type A sorting domain-containing protein [Bacteroidia bacterium]